MLSKSQKESIRYINIYKYSHEEKNGKPITNDGEDFIIPSFDEIKNTIFKRILNLGFSKIEQVSPVKANCVIRVFKKLHYTYDGTTYNMYGANCFSLRFRKWFSTSSAGMFELNHSKCIVKLWLFQDEYVEFDCDFVDYYVKIS